MKKKPNAELQLDEMNKAELIGLVLQQQAIIFELQEKIQKLEEQIAKNSRNSSKPPSSDGLKKPKAKSLREKGKRKSGGQIGHEGKTLEMVDEPDVIVVHEVANCPDCQADLGEVALEGVEKRQVFEVPPMRLEVTEHQGAIKRCPCCGKRVKATFPASVPARVQYGDRFRASLVYLSVYQLLPLARIAELMGDFYGQAVSEATIIASLNQAQQEVQPSLEAIREQLPSAPVVHGDETGQRVAGKTQWVHVTSTPRLTYYVAHTSRGQKALHEIGLLARCQGYIVHDAWASYFVYQHCHHALCNAHLLRELVFLWEEQDQTWAQELKAWLLDMKQIVEGLPSLQTLDPDLLLEYRQQFDAIVQRGWDANPLPETAKPRSKKTKAQNLLLRLERYPEAVLAFLYHPGVPFDNNLAERDLRMLKVKQKISGCFRTRTGAELFLDLRSYLSTARKHALNLLETLSQAFLGQPFIPTPS